MGSLAVQQESIEGHAQAETMQILGGYAITFAIKAAMEVGVFRALYNGIDTLEEMAQTLELKPAALRQLMRVLVSVGILQVEESGCYSTTQYGGVFQPTPYPNSIEPIAEYVLSDALILPMMNLGYSIRTGKSAFEHIMGSSWYEYGNGNPKHLTIMDHAMETYSNLSLPPLLAAYPFAQYNLIVDIAGGLGQILAGILLQNPQTKGMLFDLPATIDRANEYMHSRGLNERCQLIGGNMFKSIPAGGDLYIISKVLNDWDDEHVVDILRNISAAMSVSAKLIIMEDIESDNSSDPERAIRDLFLLACAGGRVRSVSELRGLIENAGLKIAQVIPVPSQFSIIECMSAEL